MKRLLFVAMLLLTSLAFAEPPPHFVLMWGSKGSSPGQFDAGRIAIDNSGNVYKADLYNQRVQKFTADGVYLAQWSTFRPGDTQPAWPYDLAISPRGTIYVINNSEDVVREYTLDGSFVNEWSARTGQRYEMPQSIAIDRNGNVYLTKDNRCVEKFTTDGVFITSWGQDGTNPGNFQHASGIAFDSGGNVYVADLFNDRVQKFTSNGIFLMLWHIDSRPIDIVIDGNDNVYVTVVNSDQVMKFTSSGMLLSSWGGHGAGPGQFNHPDSIALGSDGSIYVDDYLNYRVQKFSYFTAIQPSSWSTLKTLYR